MPVDRRPACQVVQKSAGHKPPNGLSRATGRASLVGSKQRVGSFGKEGEGSASLRCCGIVEETELGMDASSVKNLLTGGRHALTDLALLQMRGQGKAPVAQGLPTFS